jgi:hypothetical protein
MQAWSKHDIIMMDIEQKFIQLNGSVKQCYLTYTYTGKINFWLSVFSTEKNSMIVVFSLKKLEMYGLQVFKNLADSVFTSMNEDCSKFFQCNFIGLYSWEKKTFYFIFIGFLI